MYLLVVNGMTVMRFWQDKQASVRGERRVSEADLLGLALIGGSPGAFVARRRFRHKTRKEPFSIRLNLIAAIQVGAAAGLAFAFA